MIRFLTRRSVLAAVAALGVAPRAAVAVEDSRTGVIAARAAGLACVAVPHGLTRQLDFGLADLVVASVAELDLATLDGLLGTAGDGDRAGSGAVG